MLREHPDDEPFRVWVAGCSTGEEAYSIAILLLDAVAACGRPIRLQIFALMPMRTRSHRHGRGSTLHQRSKSCAGAVQRYFVHLGDAYRVKPELRALVVFTEQDILLDPPFSKLDWVSCRNLLIYLAPPAQEKVISLFHFALKPAACCCSGVPSLRVTGRTLYSHRQGGADLQKSTDRTRDRLGHVPHGADMPRPDCASRPRGSECQDRACSRDLPPEPDRCLCTGLDPDQ